MRARRVILTLAFGAVALAAVRTRAQGAAPPTDPYSLLPPPPARAAPSPARPPRLGPASEADRIRREAIAASAAGVVVTIGDLEDRLARATPEERARFAGPQGRRQLAREVLRAALLAEQAERRGLGNAPSVRRAERRALVEALLEREFPLSSFESAADGAPVPLAPARRRPVVLFARTRDEALALRASGPEPGDVDGWLALAARTPTPPGAPHEGGDLGYVAQTPREGERALHPVLRAALFAASEQGVASDPIRVGRVWAIVVLAAEMAEEAAPPVEDRMLAGAWARRQAALRDLVARLRREHLREFSPQALDGVAFRLPRED